MTGIAVLSAAGGADWEARLLAELGADGNAHGVQIVRRCVDVVDLLAVAASGQGAAALVSSTLRRLDADALERLDAASVSVVVVLDAASQASEDRHGGGRGSDDDDADRLRRLGVRHMVSGNAAPEVIAATIQAACAEAASRLGGVARGFGLSTAMTEPRRPDALTDVAQGPTAGELGALVAVWGPAGGPGRSTVAATLADEIARLGRAALLIDADVYGGGIATMLGLLDESPGIAAAARQAGNGRLDAEALAALCWSAEPGLRVLTGLPRADRWPELRPPAIERMLAVARSMADFTVLDVGFCLESDEELSFDTAAPRRNGATLAMLDAADVVIAVGSGDPLGLVRLLRGLDDLKEAGITAPVWIVLNRVRASATRGPSATELAAAVMRFAGQPPAAYLPYDQPGVDAAVLAGLPIARVAPGSSFRTAVIDLAMALTGATRADQARPSSRRSGGHHLRAAGR